jgi:predicted Fe-S protein YdhL (DUF1289 family)
MQRSRAVVSAVAKSSRALVRTPCVKLCQLDEATKLCKGCFRSVDEIASWLQMTDAARDAVMAGLPARRAALSANSVLKPLER